MSRKLATLRTISALRPIENADNIEVAEIDGWDVVVKKNEFITNSTIIYFEIDSWIPHEYAPFLAKGKEPQVYESIKGTRLRTIRLRSQISQGLVLNISSFSDNIQTEINKDLTINRDLTILLNIKKYDPVDPSLKQNTYNLKTFPSDVPKTDQERIQNLKKKYFNEDSIWSSENLEFEITEKMDGSSMTIIVRSSLQSSESQNNTDEDTISFNNAVDIATILMPGRITLDDASRMKQNKDIEQEIQVCSRNYSVKKDLLNIYWSVALKFIDKIIELKLFDLAFQGELVGGQIQKNRYKIKGFDFYLFDIYDIKKGSYLSSSSRLSITKELDMRHCPIISTSQKLSGSLKDLLKNAEGQSSINRCEREGLVYKCTTDTNISFKAISNNYLLETYKPGKYR